jgi:glyoxylase-like metal-dependent hydrolase (beta-lactamase superfamily II)
MASFVAFLTAEPAQRPAMPATAPSKIHRVEKLADSVYVIFGQGGNIGLIITEKHAILVDAQMENTLPGLLETVKSVTEKPIKYLINTHYHRDHVGGNAALATSVDTIVAHTNVRKRMEQEQAKLDPAKRGGLPELLLGEADPSVKARMDIRLNGTEIHLIHVGAAHTDGDMMVGVPAVKVLHMGDLVFLGMLPFIDVEAKGSFDGLVSVIEGVCSWLPEDTKVIPGHGPVCDKKMLRHYLDFLKAVQAHAKAHPAKSPKELAESFETKPWEADWKPRAEFVTWETLFEAATGKGPGRVKAKR